MLLIILITFVFTFDKIKFEIQAKLYLTGSLRYRTKVVVDITKTLQFKHSYAFASAILFWDILWESLPQAEIKGVRLYRTYLERRGLLLPPVCLECGLVFGCDSSLSLLAKEDLAATAP